ncbi:MAG: hypothetical protein RJA98_3771 [Pseudomonadota bacterium]|jgi:HD-like signal output (HDOD) protein
MPVDSQLRSLSIDIPAQPQALVKLSLLLADDEINLQALTTLIESDMALGSAVLKAVNSSLYGLSGRVQSVHQALGYLGTREVAAVTFEMGLRAVFPPAPELDPVWDRAATRGLLMGRMGQALGVDPWAAHSAGLFEECGKAVLFRHAPDRYRPLLAQAGDDDTALLALEREAFGVTHDALGAALCETWGVAPAAVQSVRHHVSVQASGELPLPMDHRRAVCVLSALARVMMTEPERLDDAAEHLAPQALLDPTLVLRGTRRLLAQLERVAAA